ncbi:MAG: MurR/RpiR family transcriptional regulator, partial [Vallitaleaceae bacterium]|nr:MurR/RpiR family transcriptional regulator [Vallitaleaceae bacterium]
MPIVMSETSREKIPHSCLVKMQSVYDSLKSAEKKAADLLLSEPTYLESASIIEAALRAGCSEATFTRLAKKLGYLGYPELKSHLTEGEVKQNASLYEDISETDDSES